MPADLPGHLVEDMEALADHPAWEWLITAIEERLAREQKYVLSGKLDHDEYIRVCASIRELEYLRGWPQTLASQARTRIGVTSVHS